MPRLSGPLDPRGRAVVSLSVGLPDHLEHRLRSLGHAVPPAIRLRALIDTGASDLALDPGVVAALGLLPTETRVVRTASSGSAGILADAYEVRASLTDAPELWSTPLEPAITLNLAHLDVEALIGRRQLRGLSFTYDGPRRTLTLQSGRGLLRWRGRGP